MPKSRIIVEAPRGHGLDLPALRAVVRRVLQAERDSPASVTIRLSDDADLHRLNREYRGRDEPTDVLSFALTESDAFPGDEDEPLELGDIAVSLETAGRQSVAHNWSLDEEVRHLVVHALLHLCGHDHEASGDALRAMLEREEGYLGPLSNVHGAD